jgi:hypothetical protein
MKTVNILSIVGISIGMFLIGMSFSPNGAQATGCPVDSIIPFIDDAIKSLENGDTQTALSQMKDARNELSDTFEVE